MIFVIVDNRLIVWRDDQIDAKWGIENRAPCRLDQQARSDRLWFHPISEIFKSFGQLVLAESCLSEVSLKLGLAQVGHQRGMDLAFEILNSVLRS